MPTTYSGDNNECVRNNYPEIDNLLPCTKVQGAQSGTLTELVVDSTESFGFSGQVQFMDSTDTLVTVTYTKKLNIGNTSGKFFFASGTYDFPDNAEVTTGDYQLDQYRTQAKGWVDTMLTNPSVPTAFKKDLEVKYVFYLVTSSHRNPEVREWGEQVLRGVNRSITTTLKLYPGVLRQNIAYLVEEGLDSTEKDILNNGPTVI